MDKEAMEMFQAILTGMQDMEARINTKFDAVNDRIDAVNNRIDCEVRGLKIMIETDVAKRIDSLFDGYQMNLEKQHELEKRVQYLEELHSIV